MCRYGIGQIYYRQEKYEMAINNFKHALSINKRSSVLQCYLGMAYHKQGRVEDALGALQDAITTDPQNPLARFEHASVLISQEKYDEAIAELEQLKVGFRPRCAVCVHLHTSISRSLHLLKWCPFQTVNARLLVYGSASFTVERFMCQKTDGCFDSKFQLAPGCFRIGLRLVNLIKA
jgi:tetratricopeptide (TPR) repeat protein